VVPYFRGWRISLVSKLKLLILSSIFPNNVETNKGIYIYHQAARLSEFCDVRVVAPVPYVPRILRNTRYSTFAAVREFETIGGLPVAHPRVFITPKIGHSAYGLFYLLSLRSYVSRAKRDFKPDVLVSYWIYPDGFASVWLGKLMHLPVIVGGLGCDVNEAGTGFLRKAAVGWTLRHSGRIMAVSEAMRSEMVKLGASPGKVRTIPNGISEDFEPMDRGDARLLLNLDGDKSPGKYVLYCGRLSAEKGVSYLVQAVALLRGRGIPVKLNLVGDGPERPMLQQMVEQLGLEKDVHFFGEVPHKDIPAYMSAADIFCLPSVREGWPNVLMECLACGTPAVASSVGGIPEIVRNEDMGLLVPKEDAAALAEALDRAINKTWDRKAISEIIRARTWRSVAGEVLEEVRLVLQ